MSGEACMSGDIFGMFVTGGYALMMMTICVVMFVALLRSK